MTTFDDREKAFENKYARDQEMQFKIIARRNRLGSDHSYSGLLVDMDRDGDLDVVASNDEPDPQLNLNTGSGGFSFGSRFGRPSGHGARCPDQFSQRLVVCYRCSR